MSQGLPVSRLIRVTVNLSPLAAQRRGFGVLLVLGDSDVLAVNEYRTYNTLGEVANDFSLVSNEYLEAQAYFSQTPKPNTIMIGRWARTDSAGRLIGGVLNASEQVMGNWTAVTNGAFKLTVKGVEKAVGSINLSAETNLNGVATQINTALTAATAGVSVVWDGDQFVFSTTDTGADATIGYLFAPAAGTDMSAMLKGTLATGAVVIDGVDAEAPIDAVARAADKSNAWFGLSVTGSTVPTDDQAIAVAGFIEGQDVERIYGVTITETDVLSNLITNDLASRLKELGYNHTVDQYSANEHAIASFFGRAFSVNFNANRSTITMMYKQEPGIVAENLDTTQANTLKDKNCNVFVEYENDTAIIQYGKMAGGAYFDEIHGLAWFRNAVQNNVYNLLYQSKTKIPQTDDGQTQIMAGVAQACEEAVNNGLVAPGQWNSDGFGQLQRGDYLDSGYYIYSPPMALQDQSIRESRVSQPIQVAIKLAGAIHEVDVIVDVNR
jgi:hypothetical protein